MMKEILLQIDNEEIVFAEFTNRENIELVVVCKSRNVFLLDCRTEKSIKLGSLEFSPEYSEDHFKSFESFGYKKEFLQINSFKNYICITQKYGQNGVVFNLENSAFNKKLRRGGYQEEHCIFPIAFYSKQNSTFLIYGTDWNRLDITSLETDELLTQRIVEYESKSNYFDYFHGSLLISPDFTKFISNGWVWQPYEVITLYTVKDFLENYELSSTAIEFEETSGYNWERPVCWIDNQTLGISYNKKEAGEIKEETPSEIIFVDILKNEIVNRIEFNGFAINEHGEVSGKLFFDSKKLYFIGLNEQTGLVVSDFNGKEIIKDENLKSFNYSPKHRLLYQLNNSNQTIEIAEKGNFDL